jgi:hypothetical protein
MGSGKHEAWVLKKSTEGKCRGEIEVLEIFGVDASWARTLKGGPFLPADLVYLKK